MPGRFLATLVAMFSVAGSSFVRAQTSPARTAVPIRKVVLFSSGVGYFEHAGTVRGDATAELRFKTAQINDVLKSLVLQDQDGGRVAAVTYPSQDPLSKTLKSFQVDITANPSLADLLNQLRGARITVQSQGERLTGTILGVERHNRVLDQEEVVQVPGLNLLAPGGVIRTIELPAVTSLTLDDPQLQDELTKALAALTQARDQDKKPVTIQFAGTGDRRVRVGYVVEAPVWKTSYRLLLGNKSSKLQGWAIVENQTESDWNDVSLSLVSGRPISFVMDLYQPLYATRPTVVPELFAGLHPQVYEGGMDSARDRIAFSAKRIAGGAASPAAAPAAPFDFQTARRAVQAQRLEAVVTTGLDADASIESAASTRDLGELFEYSVGNVTLPRQKSAMLPIITDTVGVERVSIYNASVLPRNALTGVRLTNTTGKLLLQGPVTVLDQGSYAGDARIDNVPAGQNRLLSYGIDLDLVVDNTTTAQSAHVVSAKIDKGMLEVVNKVVAVQEYRADNRGAKDKTLIIEHPVKVGWKLMDTQAPIETTPSVYRFQGKAAAKKVTVLTVREEMTRNSMLSMLNVDAGALVSYLGTGSIPKAVRDALAKAIQLKQGVTDLARQIDQHSQRLAQITQEQSRIREDMKTVASNSQYYARLLSKLDDQETSIERLQRERDDLTTRRDAQQRELENYLATLSVG